MQYIQGTVLYKNGGTLCVYTQGIGHDIETPASVWQVYNAGDKIQLFVSQIIKEDSHRYFGFTNFVDKQIFELLLSVSSVGPRLALSPFNIYKGEDIKDMVAGQAEGLLAKVPYWGAKTAQKVVLEISKKMLTVYSNAALVEVATDMLDAPDTQNQPDQNHGSTMKPPIRETNKGNHTIHPASYKETDLFGAPINNTTKKNSKNAPVGASVDTDTGKNARNIWLDLQMLLQAQEVDIVTIQSIIKKLKAYGEPKSLESIVGAAFQELAKLRGL
jgi:holliday junction DNA helicase RuvA